MTTESISTVRRLLRSLVTVATFVSVVVPRVAMTQEASTSFWFRLAPDSSVKADAVAIIDFFPEKPPLVRVHTGLATGREIENLKRTLAAVRRANNGTFPVGQRLVIARDPRRAAPDTNRIDNGGRRLVNRLRELERSAKVDHSVTPVIMTLVVDKGGKK